ncbi:MAG: orotidine 5'-phosphate decarboxylase [Candidatus Heimdallarchaeota archaeon]|nr:orotidine 5'-phosphate decarboxylase [Candidatus Heimdallarchaeota archaeon]MCK4953880.1 orotidine 5'-phosphate decarboxylase [Candidatus Heimdallarchaeota archaeon]
MSAFNSTFVEKHNQTVLNKDSFLCVSIDPALPAQRERHVMPHDDRVEFMKKIIGDVAPYTSVIKMNRQYLVGLTIDEIRALNIHIHQKGMLSIVDHKLGDIDSSNESAIFWIKEEGFDAFTFSPYGVNIEKASFLAHEKKLGILVITLMSHPEAMFHKIATIDEKPLYLYIAEMCKKAKVDGFWIGNADHIEISDVSKIKQLIGDNRIALVPLYGTNYTIIKSVIFHNKNALVDVGRAITYSDSPSEKAAYYKSLLNDFKNEIADKKTV